MGKLNLSMCQARRADAYEVFGPIAVSSIMVDRDTLGSLMRVCLVLCLALRHNLPIRDALVVSLGRVCGFRSRRRMRP